MKPLAQFYSYRVSGSYFTKIFQVVVSDFQTRVSASGHVSDFTIGHPYLLCDITPRGYSQKGRVGVYGPLPQTLTPFMIKVCNFCHPTYDLAKNLIPYLRGKYKTWTPSMDWVHGPGPSKYGPGPWTPYFLQALTLEVIKDYKTSAFCACDITFY